MLALKFLDEDGVGPYSRFRWPLPNGKKPGRWVKANGDLIACENGIHAVTPGQARDWLRPECYIIELGGRVIDAGDKLVSRRGRLLRRVDSWNDCTAQLFAADCAAHVLKFYEREYPDDKRLREAIRAARTYARTPTEANREKADAARATAWDAARATAWAAERAWQIKRLWTYLYPEGA